MTEGPVATDCHCLCIVNHVDARGICTSAAETAVTFRAPWEASGRRDVPMCSACAAATLSEKAVANA